jgi:transcriptional regulator with XRE-family HTH domain
MVLTFYMDNDYILTMDVKFIYKRFGLRLRNARKEAELTQEALAEWVGLSRTSITNIEKGRQRIPLHLLFLLASAVGVHPATLLPESKEIYKPDVIDKRLLKKTLLQQDQLEYVTTVVASGKTQEEKQEENQDESV